MSADSSAPTPILSPTDFRKKMEMLRHDGGEMPWDAPYIAQLVASHEALRDAVAVLTEERDAANEELQRLHARLENPELVVDEMHYSARDGEPMRIDLHEAGDPYATRVIAASFARTFRDSGAENYVESLWHHTDPDTGDALDLNVRIQRADRPTPHELRRAAEARVAVLEAGLREARQEAESMRVQRDIALLGGVPATKEEQT